MNLSLTSVTKAIRSNGRFFIEWNARYLNARPVYRIPPFERHREGACSGAYSSRRWASERGSRINWKSALDSHVIPSIYEDKDFFGVPIVRVGKRKTYRASTRVIV